MSGGWIERRFRCTSCNIRFTTKRSRTRHMQETHGQELRFPCPQCLKSFSRKVQLNDHINTHHGSLVLQCDSCPQQFSSSSAFNTHYNRFHATSYKYKCIRCQKPFSIRYYFQRHIQTCGRPKNRPSKLHYHTKTKEYKRKVLREIEYKIEAEQYSEDFAIETVCEQYNLLLAKVQYWWNRKELYCLPGGSARNLSGGGRPIAKWKLQLFDKTYEKFIYERYTLGIRIGNAYLGELLVCTANEMEEIQAQGGYKAADSPNNLWKDIALFRKVKTIDEYAISTLQKYHKEWLLPLLGRWYERVRALYIDEKKIKVENMWFCDETNVQKDFCMNNRTLSLKGRNSAVVKVENYKESATLCIFWNVNMLVCLCLYILIFNLLMFVSVCLCMCSFDEPLNLHNIERLQLC